MSDPYALRETISNWLDSIEQPSDLVALTDLGAVHYEVLVMLSQRIRRLREAGYSRAEIHAALTDDAVLAQHERRFGRSDEASDDADGATGVGSRGRAAGDVAIGSSAGLDAAELGHP